MKSPVFEQPANKSKLVCGGSSFSDASNLRHTSRTNLVPLLLIKSWAYRMSVMNSLSASSNELRLNFKLLLNRLDSMSISFVCSVIGVTRFSWYVRRCSAWFFKLMRTSLTSAPGDILSAVSINLRAISFKSRCVICSFNCKDTIGFVNFDSRTTNYEFSPYIIGEFVYVEVFQFRFSELVDGIFHQNGDFRHTHIVHQFLQLLIHLEAFRIFSNVGDVEVIMQFEHLDAGNIGCEYSLNGKWSRGVMLPCKWSRFDGTIQSLGTFATAPYAMLHVTSSDEY